MNELELKEKRIISDLYNKCHKNLLKEIEDKLKDNDIIKTGEKVTIRIYLGKYILNDTRCHRYNVKKDSLLQKQINIDLCCLYEELLNQNKILMYILHNYENKRFYLDIFQDKDKYKREMLKECIRLVDKFKFYIKYYFS